MKVPQLSSHISLQRTPRFLSTPKFFLRPVILLLLVLTSAGAWAADYVIKSGNYYIGMNAAGTALEAKTSFDESCIWTTTNALSTTSQSVQNKKNTSKYLVANCSRSGYYNNYTYSWTFSVGSSTAVWRGDGGNFYARYSGTVWNRQASITVATNGTISLADNDTDNSQYYQVTITECPALSQITGIDGADAIGKAGTYDYTKIGDAKAYSSAYKSYSFNTSTYYEVGNSITTTEPTGEEFTYTWSAKCSDDSYEGYSFSNGALTIIAVPETDKEITITLTATKDGQQTQTVTKVVNVSNRMPTGVDGGTVTLNDYEDHRWTYYAGVSSDVDGGNYNTNYVGKMYSPDPRNVKITYKANGGAVSIDESETEFVYYKTIEKINNAYKYQVISNPFSKRPTGKGFGGWEVVSGGSYIGKNTGDVLALDEELTLTAANLTNVAGDAYTPNCTSAEIVLKATWVDANITTITSNPGSGQNYSFTGGTYETNFIVLKNVNYTRTMTINSPCTIMMVEPDGSADYRNSYTFSGNITPNNTGVTKIENAKWNPSGNIAAGGKSLWIGRGVTTVTNQNRSITLASGGAVNQVVKMESGTFGALTHYSAAAASINKQHLILGCDYDRAKKDNSKLTFTGRFEVGSCGNGGNYATEACRVWSKSGQFMTETSIGDAPRANSYYMSNFNNNNTQKKRYIEIEGGEWFANICGGQDTGNGTNENTAFTLRMRGGKVRGSIYGSAQQNNSTANRVMVFTGGQIGGWICGAANGISAGKGVLYGSTYVYFGGNAEIATKYQERTGHATTAIQNSIGGYVYASGCGVQGDGDAGQVTISTNIVMADNATVEHGVYGGGAYGYSSGTSNVYVTGGHMESAYDTKYSVFGGVYGGARQNNGGTANVYMTGGQIDGVTNSGTHGGGLFGGSNASGTLSGNVNMVITGGQVGTSANNANIHGGGFGQLTLVNGDVDVTLGTRDESTGKTSGDAVIYGDVYGGSALGNVNGTAATTTYHTNVTLNAGTINGSLYGGALGSETVAANVYGPVQVTVNGGKVIGENSAVYGCNNVNGAPQNTVKVDVYKTDAHNAGSDEDDPADDIYAINAVYGGGNRANYTYTTTGQVYPQVTVHNCDNSIEYVYGGGNQATVPGTKVDIYGGNIIGNVFGGGNNANVTTNGTDVNIYGGTILNVYGGNNNGGAITGTINVDVVESKETDSSTLCPVNITDLYGGGNKAASAAGNITIGKCSNISNVYGGANQANVTGDITLNIVDGNVGTVFGGNNNSGTITGAITVNVSWNGSAKENESDTSTRRSLGSVYGGGNKAPYTGNPTVNFTKGITTGSVFGGGLGTDAIVTGNPTVNIGDWATKDDVIIGGDVFGGGDLAAVEGDPTVTVRECGTIIEGDLYGGGNAAPVYSTNTTMWGGTVMGNVFGGGNGADSTKNANGAQVGYKHDDETAGTGDGNAVLNVYGGTVGTWTTDSSTGVSTCQDGTGGVFGGSNTNGNIRGEVRLKLNQQTETGTQNPNNETCSLKLNEVYGSGNEAAYAGTGINFTLGCVDALEKIYGGAKNADMNGNIHLKITSGTFKQVFGGNNIGGKINGTIKVTVDETGCHPVIIDELYGGGNQAPYSIYGYEADLDANTKKPIPLTTLPSGGTAKDSPVVNVVSCTHIGQVFGGGLGSTAVMVGNPTVNIQQIPGAYDPDDTDGTNGWAANPGTKLGTIGTVFGGGNAAKVEGETYVNIGTETAILRADGTTSIDKKGANITGNVYGGGNQADVTGKTHVQVGPKPTN